MAVVPRQASTTSPARFWLYFPMSYRNRSCRGPGLTGDFLIVMGFFIQFSNCGLHMVVLKTAFCYIVASLPPPWFTDRFNLPDNPLGFLQLSGILVVEDTLPNLPQQSLVLEMPSVKPDCFGQAVSTH